MDERRLNSVVQVVDGRAAFSAEQTLSRHLVPTLKDRNQVVHVVYSAVLELELIMKVLQPFGRR